MTDTSRATTAKELAAALINHARALENGMEPAIQYVPWIAKEFQDAASMLLALSTENADLRKENERLRGIEERAEAEWNRQPNKIVQRILHGEESV